MKICVAQLIRNTHKNGIKSILLIKNIYNCSKNLIYNVFLKFQLKHTKLTVIKAKNQNSTNIMREEQRFFENTNIIY